MQTTPALKFNIILDEDYVVMRLMDGRLKHLEYVFVDFFNTCKHMHFVYIKKNREAVVCQGDIKFLHKCIQGCLAKTGVVHGQVLGSITVFSMTSAFIVNMIV
jgi:hypothetical protein